MRQLTDILQQNIKVINDKNLLNLLAGAELVRTIPSSCFNPEYMKTIHNVI